MTNHWLMAMLSLLLLLSVLALHCRKHKRSVQLGKTEHQGPQPPNQQARHMMCLITQCITYLLSPCLHISLQFLCAEEHLSCAQHVICGAQAVIVKHLQVAKQKCLSTEADTASVRLAHPTNSSHEVRGWHFGQCLDVPRQQPQVPGLRAWEPLVVCCRPEHTILLLCHLKAEAPVRVIHQQEAFPFL